MLLWGRRNIFKGNGRMMLWEKVENNIARTEGKGGTRKVGRRRRMLLRGWRKMFLRKRRRMLLREQKDVAERVEKDVSEKEEKNVAERAEGCC